MPPERLVMPSLLAWVRQIPPGNCWACEGLRELRLEVCFIFPDIREAGRKQELTCCFSPLPHQGQPHRDSPRHWGAVPLHQVAFTEKKQEGEKKKNTIYYQERKKPAHTKHQAHLCKQHNVSVKGMRLEFIRYIDKTQLMMVLPCIFPLPTWGEVSTVRGYGIFPKPTNI